MLANRVLQGAIQAYFRLPRLISKTIGLIFVLGLPLAYSDAFAAGHKRVLVLHSFSHDARPWSDYAKMIPAELNSQSPWSLDIIEYSLVSARFAGDQSEGPFVEYLRALFAEYSLDLIISVGAPAGAFVQRHRRQLFPTTPLIFTAVEERRVQQSALSRNDVVIAVRADFLMLLKSILQVLPNTKTVAIVNGRSPTEQFWRAEMLREMKPLEDRVTFTYYSDLSFGQILDRAATLPHDSAIFWQLMNVDAAGVVHDSDTAFRKLHAAAKAPIFSSQGGFFGFGVVGGPMYSVADLSRQTAAVGVRLMGGEKPDEIKIEPSGFARPKYDWREMERWGISENRLPLGSDILFRSPTALERYRVEFLGSAFLIVMQACLIGWLLYEHRRRHRSEVAAHALSGRLIGAQEEERSRLARELHDDVSQRLASLAIHAGTEEKKLPLGSGGAAMRMMREGLVRLGEDVHSLSYRLHPSILHHLGLREALLAECEHFAQTYSFEIEVNADAISDPSSDVGLCLFRVAQESLQNIVRHAAASQATMRLRDFDGGLQLVVRDNGVGFNPALKSKKASLGLASMRQRVALLGGKLNIESNSGYGTTVTAWVPRLGENGLFVVHGLTP